MDDPRDPLVLPHPPHRAAGVTDPMARWHPLLAISGLFLAGQSVSALLLSLTLGQYSWTRVWLHGLAGPLVAVEGVTKFPYHPWWQNGLYLVLTAVVASAPLALLRVPGRRGLIISATGVVAWVLFGLSQSIHHL